MRFAHNNNNKTRLGMLMSQTPLCLLWMENAFGLADTKISASREVWLCECEENFTENNYRPGLVCKNTKSLLED